ncbi:hypothetical protein [Kitasatospora sp. NPDC059327]|uniref:ParB/RepB/Spo0J family partition protein n=1 Tax=Kitasatospora sp. NPDC059327 TaxID=3346803 RepID=UPI0036CACD24
MPRAQIAPCPQNLRGDDLFETEEARQKLVTNLRENGLIQALVVVDLAVYLDEFPEHKDGFDDEHKYVIVAGHCRYDCAGDAGLEELRVDVQNQYVDKLTEIFLGENISRNDLTPFQEALGFLRLAEKGYSRQKIADASGRSKSFVVKMLAILPLADHPGLKKAVLQKRLSAEQAYLLMKDLHTADLVWRAHVAFLFKEVSSLEEAIAKVLLDPEGPAPEAGGSPRTDEQPNADTPAPEAGGSPRTDEQPNADTPAPEVPAQRETAAVEEARARAVAAQARGEKCAILIKEFPLTDPPSPTALRTAIAALDMIGKRGLGIAHKWMVVAGAELATSFADAQAYREHVLVAGSPTLKAQFGYAAALAEDEIWASDARRKADRRVLGYLTYLRDEAGYEPNAFERAHLPTPTSGV